MTSRKFSLIDDNLLGLCLENELEYFLLQLFLLLLFQELPLLDLFRLYVDRLRDEFENQLLEAVSQTKTIPELVGARHF